jgi:hypothetical protein
LHLAHHTGAGATRSTRSAAQRAVIAGTRYRSYGSAAVPSSCHGSWWGM